MNIPPLTLTLGQVAWILALGQEPKRHMLDKLNYLRQLGIPFEQGQRQLGSGNRVSYSYAEMVEMGVGLWGLMHGVKPSVITKFLIGQRTSLRDLYVQALLELPPTALDAPWVRSRGKSGAVRENDILLRLHDMYDKPLGKFEVVFQKDLQNSSFDQFVNTVEITGLGSPKLLMPLTTMAIQWLAWALQAPPIRPGRRACKGG